MNIRLMLACAAGVAVAASAAAAQPDHIIDRIETAVFVSDAGVDFSNPASTATFYGTLRRAADKACESGMDGRNVTIAAEDSRCAALSLDRAVQQLGKPLLVAMHSKKTGRPMPVTVLAAQ